GVRLRPDVVYVRLLIDTYCRPTHRLRTVRLHGRYRVVLKMTTCEGDDDAAHTSMVQCERSTSHVAGTTGLRLYRCATLRSIASTQPSTRHSTCLQSVTVRCLRCQ